MCAFGTPGGQTQQSKPLDGVGKSDGVAMVCACMYMHTQESKSLHLHLHLHGIFLEMVIISVVNCKDLS